MKKIERALISTYDKTDLIEIANTLVKYGVEILSTGGTARHLREAGIELMDVSDYTGFPEMLDGRVKTLHPKIHGGLLAQWDNSEHASQANDNGISPIDMVICNLYPFEATIAKLDVTLEEAIENIDIGGPTMIRAAAKNYKHVAVLTNPNQYTQIIADLETNDGCLSESGRFELAKTAFVHTAQYDSAISTYLANLESEDDFADSLTLRFQKADSLRYGENPHQRAAFYRTETSQVPCAAWAKQLNGSPLSFNNILDLDAALEIVKDFTTPACAIIKHNNPCGLATAGNLQDAFTNALECDRTSAFGSIVGLNRKVTIQTANDSLTLRFQKADSLRYGENPHQRAAFYRTETSQVPCAAWAKQLNGSPLSFNNILDLDAALEIVKDFTTPACAIIKHNNPCGLATAGNLQDAFTNALECDRTSAFGSIVGLNRKVTIQTANTIRDAAKSGVKIEAIIAPSYTDKALSALSRVENRRILETGSLSDSEPTMQFRNVTGGVLVQEQDVYNIEKDALKVVTKRKPIDDEIESLLFAWKACKHVKSNCILLAQDTQTVGIGAGQMSRVDAAIIAVRKAGKKAKDAVLASDAFFPFPDGVEIAGDAGIRAIIQPGGSVNDAAVIETADAYGIAMVLTGVRHFRH